MSSDSLRQMWFLAYCRYEVPRPLLKGLLLSLVAGTSFSGCNPLLPTPVTYRPKRTLRFLDTKNRDLLSPYTDTLVLASVSAVGVRRTHYS